MGHRKWDVTSEKVALERCWGEYWIDKEMGTVCDAKDLITPLWRCRTGKKHQR